MAAVVRRAHQTRQFMGTTRWTRRTYACVMAQIIRPVRGKVQVRLPYQPHGANYHLLQDICGEQTRPKWRSELRVFEVAREHLTKLIDRLSAAIGEPVEVVLPRGHPNEVCLGVAGYDFDHPTFNWSCEDEEIDRALAFLTTDVEESGRNRLLDMASPASKAGKSSRSRSCSRCRSRDQPKAVSAADVLIHGWTRRHWAGCSARQ
jgi:hypothetical protein